MLPTHLDTCSKHARAGPMHPVISSKPPGFAVFSSLTPTICSHFFPDSHRYRRLLLCQGQTHSLGMCPDWYSHPWPYSFMSQCSNKPHWPGLLVTSLAGPFHILRGESWSSSLAWACSWEPGDVAIHWLIHYSIAIKWLLSMEYWSGFFSSIDFCLFPSFHSNRMLWDGLFLPFVATSP